jgi:hypothetical protein
LYVQFDNASDNKNKSVLGFLAWMVLKGYIDEAELAMMMPGHTHEGGFACTSLCPACAYDAAPHLSIASPQRAATGRRQGDDRAAPPSHLFVCTRTDIDAAFRVIAEHFYQLGMILNVDDFIAQLRASWEGGKHGDNTVVDTVDVVFDYKLWFDEVVYDAQEPTLVRADTHAQVKGITSARYFLIRKRSDGVVCFWYKPQPAHPWLYPTKKDEMGEPMYTVKDNERCYDIPCPDGIEIFHKEFKGGPAEAAPKHAKFPEGLLDVSRPLTHELDSARSHSHGCASRHTHTPSMIHRGRSRTVRRRFGRFNRKSHPWPA